MDDFEYLIALVSVIAGLGITRALSGTARIINARRDVVFSWIPICWTVSVLLWMVAFWWFTFLLSTTENWSPWLHVFVLVYASAIFFLLAVLHPESIESGHDMLEHFLDNRRVFFGALFAVALIDLVDTLIKLKLELSLPALAAYLPFMVFWVGLSAACFFVANKAFQRLCAVAFLVMVVAWLSFSIEGILLAMVSEG